MNPTSDLAVEAIGLVKTFGATRAVDGVDLVVPAGGVYALLGPPGAGKTTTVRTLAALLRPDAGTARVFGHDLVRAADTVRGLVGLSGQRTTVDDELTGRENLVLLARLSGYGWRAARERADALLTAFGLTDAAGGLVQSYPDGPRRRLDLAASVVVPPDLLLLDEPTAGLDPGDRERVWEVVRALAATGGTVLLATDRIEEADQLADRVALIDHGRILAEGTGAELGTSAGAGVLRVRLREAVHRPEAELVLGRTLGVPVVREPDPLALAARVDEPARVASALAELARTGLDVTDFSLGRPGLDEVFLALGGTPAGPPGAASTSVLDSVPAARQPEAPA